MSAGTQNAHAGITVTTPGLMTSAVGVEKLGETKMKHDRAYHDKVAGQIIFDIQPLIIDPTELLRGWHTLQPALPEIDDISMIFTMLKVEAQTKSRQFILNRLKSRLAKIVTDEILEIANDVIREAKAEYPRPV